MGYTKNSKPKPQEESITTRMLLENRRLTFIFFPASLRLGPVRDIGGPAVHGCHVQLGLRDSSAPLT